MVSQIIILIKDARERGADQGEGVGYTGTSWLALSLVVRRRLS